jgi:hypothetical protein
LKGRKTLHLCDSSAGYITPENANVFALLLAPTI